MKSGLDDPQFARRKILVRVLGCAVVLEYRSSLGRAAGKCVEDKTENDHKEDKAANYDLHKGFPLDERDKYTRIAARPKELFDPVKRKRLSIRTALLLISRSRPSYAHDLLFFVLGKFIDFSNKCVGMFLDLVESAAFIVLGNGLVFQKFL